MIPRTAALTIMAAPLAVIALLLVSAGAQETQKQEPQNTDATVQKLQERIEELESRIAVLERRLRHLEGAKVPLRFEVPQQPILPLPQAPYRLVPPRPLPEGWQRRQINGLEYYLVPLDGKLKPKP